MTFKRRSKLVFLCVQKKDEILKWRMNFDSSTGMYKVPSIYLLRMDYVGILLPIF